MTKIVIDITSNRDVSVSINSSKFLGNRTLEIVHNKIEKEYLRMKGDALRAAKKDTAQAERDADAAAAEATKLANAEAEELAKFQSEAHENAVARLSDMSKEDKERTIELLAQEEEEELDNILLANADAQAKKEFEERNSNTADEEDDSEGEVPPDDSDGDKPEGSKSESVKETS